MSFHLSSSLQHGAYLPGAPHCTLYINCSATNKGDVNHGYSDSAHRDLRGSMPRQRRLSDAVGRFKGLHLNLFLTNPKILALINRSWFSTFRKNLEVAAIAINR